MSSVETGQMSAVETGQMTAAETSVLSHQKKAQVQSWLTKVLVLSKNINFGLKWIENRRFDLKLTVAPRFIGASRFEVGGMA